MVEQIISCSEEDPPTNSTNIVILPPDDNVVSDEDNGDDEEGGPKGSDNVGCQLMNQQAELEIQHTYNSYSKEGYIQKHLW